MTAHTLLTGASGFLGAYLAQLWSRTGRPWTGLVRENSSRSGLPPGSDLVQGDLTDPVALNAACAHVAERAGLAGIPACVVHSGALISYRTADAATARRVNVEGTRNVIEACVAHGIQRLVHVSSVVAVGHADHAGATLDESADFNGGPLGSHYVTTKRAAEDFALAAVPELEVIVVCPGAVYGPSHRTTNTRRFLERIRDGFPGPWAPPGSLAVVGVSDVANGIDLALERGRDRRRYILSESNWTLTELFTAASALLGGRTRVRGPAPRALWNAIVAGAGLVDRVRPLQVTTPQALRLLGLHYRFEARRAREELGWQPQPFQEVLAETAAWLQST